MRRARVRVGVLLLIGGACGPGAPPPADPAAVPPERPRLPGLAYPSDARHSPIDVPLVEHWRAVVARGPDRAPDVFAKIGDSITAPPTYLGCFDDPDVDLGAHGQLLATLRHFRGGDAAGTSPFARVSQAAAPGWTASRPLLGRPSPLERELDEVRPRYATIMFGTNDAGSSARPAVSYDEFVRSMAALVDTVMDGGTLPILSTIPPRDDDRRADGRVPVLNGLVRALAASRGVPLVDLHRALLALPHHGLSADRIHAAAAPEGACALDPGALQYAANARNLLVLEALDRLHRILTTTTATVAAAVPRLAGHGTRAEPFVIPALPFAGAADTALDGVAEVDRWSACSTGDHGGPEVRFRFTITGTTTRVAATVAAGAGAIVDVQLVRAGDGGDGCLAQHPDEVVATLPVGEYDVVLDTFVRDGTARPGEAFVFVRAVE